MLRIATIEDIPYVLEFCKEFQQTTEYKELKFDEDKVTAFLSSLIDNDKSIIILLVNKDDIPVGALIGTSEEVIFGRDNIAIEIMYWVNPEYRGINSWDLVNAYVYWANKLKCTICSLSSLEGEYVNKLDIKYKQLGFQPAEHSYFKVL